MFSKKSTNTKTIDKKHSSQLEELASKCFLQQSRDLLEKKKKPERDDFTIIWRNLSYKIILTRWFHIVNYLTGQSVNDADQKCQYDRVVFDKICGQIKSREITAIMGRSGAGKSSLLQCLFRNKSKGVTGQILVNSSCKKTLKICFIPQHDYLNEWLTVREDLMFVSQLKYTNIGELKESNLLDDEEVTRSIDHEKIVAKMANLVGLVSCLDVPIKRISGGERKRLSIARELMSKPDILVLDEPTTGLDSLTCHKTIAVLRDLVKNAINPMAVVVTIHQPERAVFNLFDKAYFLTNGRGIVYDEDPKLAVQVMQDIGKISMPSSSYNPASFLIELASDQLHHKERDLMTQHQRLQFNECIPNTEIFNLLGYLGRKALQISDSIVVDYNGTMLPSLQNETGNLISNASNSDGYFVSNQLADCIDSHSIDLSKSFKHISILTRRAWICIIRNPSLTKSRLILHLFLPLFMLAVFGTKMGSKSSCPILGEGLNLDRMKRDILDGTISKVYDDYRYVTENMVFFFIATYGFSINIVCMAASFYPQTLSMFKKETSNGLYTIGSSVIAQILAELPFEFFFPAISGLLSYKLSGQVDSYLQWRLIYLCFAMFLCCYFVHCMGLIAGILCSDNVSAAVIIGQMSLMPFVTTCGFIIRYSRLPWFLKYLANWSIYKHFTNGFIAARYGFNICNCDEDSLQDSKQTFLTLNVRHTMDYLFENETRHLGNNVQISDLFTKINKQFMEAQTYGLKLDSCNDVKPYIMETYTVEDEDLYRLPMFAITGIVILKLIVYILLKYKKM